MYKIYQIENLDNGEKYVGHTKQKMNVRLNQHRRKEKQKISCKNFNWNNIKVDILEEFNESNFNDIRIKERLYIEKTENCVNKDRPIVTEEENKIKHKEAKAKWGLPKYNCECGSTIQVQEKSRHFKSKKHITFSHN